MNNGLSIQSSNAPISGYRPGPSPVGRPASGIEIPVGGATYDSANHYTAVNELRLYGDGDAKADVRVVRGAGGTAQIQVPDGHGGWRAPANDRERQSALTLVKQHCDEQSRIAASEPNSAYGRDAAKIADLLREGIEATTQTCYQPDIRPLGAATSDPVSPAVRFPR